LPLFTGVSEESRMDMHRMWAFDLLIGLGTFLENLFRGIAAFFEALFQ
jgi:hypothetical protein